VFTCCWSAKGGSGVSVVAAALALHASRATPTVLVDLCGDLPAILGLAQPDGPGAAEWSRDGRRVTGMVDVSPTLRLLPRGRGALRTLPSHAFEQFGGGVVVDAGCVSDGGARADLATSADRSLLVIRPCYLALRRAAHLSVRPHGVVVVHEPGRALNANDIASVVGAPVVAELPLDPAVARAVDAGLLASRCPRQLTQVIEALA
jgi:hypothetical protein